VSREGKMTDKNGKAENRPIFKKIVVEFEIDDSHPVYERLWFHDAMEDLMCKHDFIKSSRLL